MGAGRTGVFAGNPPMDGRAGTATGGLLFVGRFETALRVGRPAGQGFIGEVERGQDRGRPVYFQREPI